MQRSQPFARSLITAALVAAAMSAPAHVRQAKLAEIPPYESRGKGKGGSNRRAPGAQMAGIRAARKVKNVRRHRAHCRG